MLTPIWNPARDYSWGSPDLIPHLLGVEPTGAPQAEIWYGDHPGSPSRVVGSETTLDAQLAAHGEPPLPYLMKLLAAGSSLSIQAHPAKGQAEEGFAREERTGPGRDAPDRLYRDDNHKPEIIVALTDPFRALVGVRDVPATLRLLAALGDAPALRTFGDLVAAAGEDGPRAAIEWALSAATPADVAALSAGLDAAHSDEFPDEIAVLRAAAADFPGDRGLFVAALMNLVTLHPGEALFAPAGVLHAYQSGLGVELMAASDNVLRGGLTPKHVDVPELLHVLDARTGAAPLVVPREVADGIHLYAPPVPDFALLRVSLSSAPREVALQGSSIVLVTAGAVTVTDGSQAVDLVPGAAVHVSGDTDRITLSGTGEAFVAQPGDDRLRHAVAEQEGSMTA